MLTKLKNGQYLDLSTVQAIRLGEMVPADHHMKDPIKDRVIIDYRVCDHHNCEIVYFDSLQQAAEYREELFKEVEKASAQARREKWAQARREKWAQARRDK